MAKKDEEKPLIIKKVKKGNKGGHHGGAWKVAYADFTTAMMAFFMLLWLLNVTDQETLDGLADYFTPTSASISSMSGSGRPLAGSAMDSSDSMGASASITRIQGPPPTANRDTDNIARAKDSSETPHATFKDKLREEDDQALKALEETLRQAVQESPELARHKDQILIEQTPEGVRIQITDKDGRSMFRDGTAELYGYAQRLLREFGAIIATLPNRIAIKGHTDSVAFGRGTDYTNWELSADRANTSRRHLSRSGVSSDRFSEATGKAATEPLYPTDTTRAENRRITILVLREAPVIAPSASNRN